MSVSDVVNTHFVIVLFKKCCLFVRIVEVQA